MKSARFIKQAAGFTLIELLVVIGILAVLLSIVLIAINPAHQFALARNTQRRSDVLTILNAVHQYYAEKGSLPPGITTTSQDINNTNFGPFCTDLVPTYVAALPFDPGNGTGTNPSSFTSCTAFDTGYWISESATDNRVTVTAPQTELGIPTISVTR